MIDLFYSSIGEKLTEIIRDAFGVNLLELIINLVATIILILIVRFLFWNKVTAFLDKKKENLKNAYKETDEIKEEAEQIKRDAEKTLDESREKAREIVRNAEESAGKEKERIIEGAKRDASEIIENSKEEALREKVNQRLPGCFVYMREPVRLFRGEHRRNNVRPQYNS